MPVRDVRESGRRGQIFHRSENHRRIRLAMSLESVILPRQDRCMHPLSHGLELNMSNPFFDHPILNSPYECPHSGNENTGST